VSRRTVKGLARDLDVLRVEVAELRPRAEAWDLMVKAISDALDAEIEQTVSDKVDEALDSLTVEITR